MANNQAQDRYNPKGINEDDFDATTFSELPDGALFWLHGNKKENNPAFRKLDARKALHTQGRHIVPMPKNKPIFIKI